MRAQRIYDEAIQVREYGKKGWVLESVIASIMDELEVDKDDNETYMFLLESIKARKNLTIIQKALPDDIRHSIFKAKEVYDEALEIRGLIEDFPYITECIIHSIMENLGLEKDDIAFDVILDLLDNGCRFNNLLNELEING